ncbi:unnamed protein product, partial [Owenia fusiformis]
KFFQKWLKQLFVSKYSTCTLRLYISDENDNSSHFEWAYKHLPFELAFKHLPFYAKFYMKSITFQVSRLSTPESLFCDCRLKMTIFTGSFIAFPNKIDPFNDAKLFLTFFDNPVTVSMMIVVWALFVILAVYARKRDRKDLLH